MPTMNELLRDDSLSLLARGYDFGAHLWQRTREGARAVPFRLLGREALLVRGSDGVALFYDETRTRRHKAMPAFIQQSLFGNGSVHSLDGAEHRHRKAPFIKVLYDDEQVARLMPYLETQWQSELDAWVAGGTRTAYEAAIGALGRAIMKWAGIPGTAAAQTRWAKREAQIVDDFGSPYSPVYLLALVNRWWSNRHAAQLIEATRAGRLQPAEGTALHEWAWHRDRDGELLSPRLAGVELQNSFRPMIAVCRFVAFAAKELHDRPEWRERIAAETAERGALTGGELTTMFAQEVRRLSPFVPMLPAWATTDIEHDGERVAAGGRVLLDILGTDSDAEEWERADEFDPERWRDVDDYEAIEAFVPHGGADPATGHRCPGEKLAIAGLAAAIATISDPRVMILGSNLDVNRGRLPTKPRSGGRVRAAGASGSRCPFH